MDFVRCLRRASLRFLYHHRKLPACLDEKRAEQKERNLLHGAGPQAKTITRRIECQGPEGLARETPDETHSS